MIAEAKKPIRLDLNQFKLHLYLKSGAELTIHFDSPSRKFYLAVIGLVVDEMKKQERVISIPLEKHLGVLALLNETIGKSAGSSKKEHLLPRIYKKWKTALPDLENAPLFKVVGRKKRPDELTENVYRFSEDEKDRWANLFEYKGSHEHVRLRFSIDRLDADLNDLIMVYGQDPQTATVNAWERFIGHLKEKREALSPSEQTYQETGAPDSPQRLPGKWLQTIPSRWLWPALITLIAFVLGTAAFVIWKKISPAPPVEIASMGKNAYPRKDRPFIAVLPFKNISDDPEQEYFCDGMTEDIITDLSKVSGLLVTARNSVFSYKGVTKKVGEIASELGVRYILEGSVRKSGAVVRINAQLIDSKTEEHLWAERYDRELNNIFALQDEIVKKITSALAVKLTQEEKAQIDKIHTDNLEAYDQYLRGLHAMSRKVYGGTIEHLYQGLTEAKSLFEKAIEKDPGFGKAYVSAALVNYFAIENDLPIANLSGSFPEALKHISKALAIDSTLPMAHSILAGLQAWESHFEESIISARKAINLDPNSADSHLILAYILTQAGEHEEALESINQAFILNPKPPSFYYDYLGYIQFNHRQYENAISSYNKAGGISAIIYSYALVACYAYVGRLEEAKAALDDIKKVDEHVSLAYLDQFVRRYKKEIDGQHYIEGFRKAGAPEFPYGFKGEKADMLSTEEIRTLIVGRVQTGYSPVAKIDKDRNPQWWMHYRNDGTCNMSGFWENTCEYKILNNRCYVKFNEMNDGRWFWWNFFRNPNGTSEELNEYFAVGKAMVSFSVQ